MINDTGIKNIAQLFLPFVLNSSIPISAKKIPSSKDDIGPYEKSFVIKPYAETAITTKTRIILMIFNSIPPRIIHYLPSYLKKKGALPLFK